MTVRNCAFSCLLAFVLLTAGCASSSPTQGVATGAPANGQCDAAYAYAPGAYVINIVSGDAVILDPMSNDFFLFCTPQAAQNHLKKRIAEKNLPQGDWKIYRVHGTWKEITSEVAPNTFLLNVPAPLVDWVN